VVRGGGASQQASQHKLTHNGGGGGGEGRFGRGFETRSRKGCPWLQHTLVEPFVHCGGHCHLDALGQRIHFLLHKLLNDACLFTNVLL
jgi:hypothetical protein